MWPAKIIFPSPCSFTATDQRRIVSVDTSLSLENPKDKDEIDEEWLSPNNCIIIRETAENGDKSHYEIFQGSLWNAAKSANNSSKVENPSHSVNFVGAIENLMNPAESISSSVDPSLNATRQVLASTLKQQSTVFLQRRANFRRYIIVPKSSEDESIEAATNSHAVDRKISPKVESIPLPPNAQFYSPSRANTTTIVSAGSNSVENSGSEFSGSAAPLPVLAGPISIRDENVDDDANDVDGNEHSRSAATGNDGDGQESGDDQANSGSGSGGGGGAAGGGGARHSRRHKVFSQAIAFEFVQDVIGAVMVQRAADSRANTPSI